MVRRADVYPLDLLPADKQDEIRRAVEQDAPPPRYRHFGAPGGDRPLAQVDSRAWYEWHWHRGITPQRPQMDPGLRAAVIARDGYTCQLCGEATDPANIHIDHIKPYSHGGPDRLDNLQVTHPACNLRKGNRS